MSLSDSSDLPSERLTSSDVQNRRTLRKLVVTMKAGLQQTELLVAICDDRNLQASIIDAYEAELRETGITPFQARLDFKRPSLRASLEGLVAREAALQAGEPAVVTVLNAEALLGIRMGEEKSEQERFFFSLQWTREALLRFEFPVVLWVPQAVATRMGREAPDFWSWRGGVFEFAALAALSHPEMAFDSAQATAGQQAMDRQTEEPVGALSVEELQGQIAGLVETAPESSLLITLYNNLGEAYARQYEYMKAMAQYKKALGLAKRKNNLAGQARSLMNLGSSLWRSGRSQQAIEYYKQSLEIARASSDRKGEAQSLKNLGNTYHSLGQYQRAIGFYQQSLEIARETGDRRGEAASLENLGIAYKNLCQYQRAIDFHQQSLEIVREIENRQGEAASLNNLGNAYYSLDQYQRAIDFHQRSLEIAREIGDCQGKAASLSSLGLAYYSLGQHQQGIDFQQQSLEIAREIGDCQGEAASLSSLGLAYYSLGQHQQGY